jgi:hypothetical protein
MAASLRCSNQEHGPWTCGFALATSIILATLPVRADDIFTDAKQLQFDLQDAEPANGHAALAGVPDRSRRVTEWMACNEEVDFLKLLNDPNSSESMLFRIIGKVAFISASFRNPNGVCSGSFKVYITDQDRPDIADDLRAIDPSSGSLRNPNPGVMLTKQFQNSTRQQNPNMNCGPEIIFTREDAHPRVASDEVSVTTTLPSLCLRAQVNNALRQMQQGDRHLGSSQVPCYGFVGGLFAGGVSVAGEWDISVRDLV